MVAVRCHLFLLLFFSLLPYLAFSLSEQETLLKLKKSFTNTTALNNWVPEPGSSICNWSGVRCENGIVNGLLLGEMGLSGTIDVGALRELKGLRTISFVNDNFSGKIPDFHMLGSLKGLGLTGNGFSGEIPSEYFSGMTSLKKIYLAGNKFTGKIPESLTQLKNLMVLRLEGNQFSGAIPEFKQKGLTELDLSNNKLEGPIPNDMSRYNEKSFAGNEGLCGGPFKSCDDKTSPPPPSAPPPANEKKSSSNTIKIIIGVVVGVIILLMVVVIIRQRSQRRREDEFSVLGKEKMNEHLPHQQRHDEVVEVHVPPSYGSRSVASTATTTNNNNVEANSSRSVEKNANNMEAVPSSRAGSSKKGGDSKKGSSGGKSRGGSSSPNELLMVNDQKGTFGLPDLMKAAAEVLGNGGLGSAYKAVMVNGLSVVVKRMREMNRLGKEGFDAEMKRFGRLRHKNILTPLAYHYRREEKLLISEYIPKGSLLYVLHGDRGIAHSELNWPRRLKIIRGVASGMEFLHTEFASYDLPHGNLKSSNILLQDDYEPVLNDYACHPLINPNNASQSMIAFKTPEFIDSQQVSPKSDVYCLGIVILEILTGKFPCQYLSNGKGGIDVVQWVQSAMAEQGEQELLDPEVASSPESVSQMQQLLQIGADCADSNPDRRPDIREANRRIVELQV